MQTTCFWQRAAVLQRTGRQLRQGFHDGGPPKAIGVPPPVRAGPPHLFKPWPLQRQVKSCAAVSALPERWGGVLTDPREPWRMRVKCLELSLCCTEALRLEPKGAGEERQYQTTPYHTTPHCMYTCIHMYMYMHAHAHTYTHTDTNVRVCVRVC